MLGTLSEGGSAHVAVDLDNTTSKKASERVGFRPLFHYGVKLLACSILGLADENVRIVSSQRALDRRAVDAGRIRVSYGER